MIRRPPRSTRTDTLLPYTTLFRSIHSIRQCHRCRVERLLAIATGAGQFQVQRIGEQFAPIVQYPRRRVVTTTGEMVPDQTLAPGNDYQPAAIIVQPGRLDTHQIAARSEERRVGKECVSPFRSRW